MSKKLLVAFLSAILLLPSLALAKSHKPPPTPDNIRVAIINPPAGATLHAGPYNVAVSVADLTDSDIWFVRFFLDDEFVGDVYNGQYLWVQAYQLSVGQAELRACAYDLKYNVACTAPTVVTVVP